MHLTIPAFFCFVFAAEFCKEQDIPDTTFKDPPPPPTERNIKRARRVVRHEIYRPSILGPASLKATSFPETLTTSTRDQEPHVVSSRSRDRERDRDRDSQRESYNTTGATATPVVSSVDIPGPTSTEEPSKPNGKSERVGGPSVRGSATSSLSDNTSCHDKSGGNGSSAYATSSSKKQSQKNQTQEKKTKKRKAKQSSNSSSKEDNSPQQYAIDPDEPTYCLCDQVSTINFSNFIAHNVVPACMFIPNVPLLRIIYSIFFFAFPGFLWGNDRL